MPHQFSYRLISGFLEWGVTNVYEHLLERCLSLYPGILALRYRQMISEGGREGVLSSYNSRSTIKICSVAFSDNLLHFIRARILRGTLLMVIL